MPRQDSLTDQIATMRRLALEAGCYDAVDWLDRTLNPAPNWRDNAIERLSKREREMIGHALIRTAAWQYPVPFRGGERPTTDEIDALYLKITGRAYDRPDDETRRRNAEASKVVQHYSNAYEGY